MVNVRQGSVVDDIDYGTNHGGGVPGDSIQKWF